MMKRDQNNFFLFLSIPYNCFQYLAMACYVSSLVGSGSVQKVYAGKQQNTFILQHGNVIYGCSSIQLFRESLSRIKCTRQSRKVIWDMINTLFLTTVAVEPTFVTFLQHSQTYMYISGLPYDSFKFL